MGPVKTGRRQPVTQLTNIRGGYHDENTEMRKRNELPKYGGREFQEKKMARNAVSLPKF